MKIQAYQGNGKREEKDQTQVKRKGTLNEGTWVAFSVAVRWRKRWRRLSAYQIHNHPDVDIQHANKQEGGEVIPRYWKSD